MNAMINALANGYLPVDMGADPALLDAMSALRARVRHQVEVALAPLGPVAIQGACDAVQILAAIDATEAQAIEFAVDLASVIMGSAIEIDRTVGTVRVTVEDAGADDFLVRFDGKPVLIIAPEHEIGVFFDPYWDALLPVPTGMF